MSSNLCVEAAGVTWAGLEVDAVKDATAGARHPELLADGYQAGLVNFGYMANQVVTTEETTARLKQAVAVS